jgi:hypothetical protein
MSPANEDHLTIARAEQVHRRAPELGWPRPSVARGMNSIMGAGYPKERAEHSPQEERSGGEASRLYVS